MKRFFRRGRRSNTPTDSEVTVPKDGGAIHTETVSDEKAPEIDSGATVPTMMSPKDDGTICMKTIAEEDAGVEHAEVAVPKDDGVIHMETISDEKAAFDDREAKIRRAVLKVMRKDAIKRFHKSVQDAEHVDLCFVIDSTGSMASYIASVKKGIKQIVNRVMTTNKDLKLRLAAVAYRDIRDKNQFEVLDFTNDVDKFETWVGKLEATGGGDTPEDIAGAIHKATKLDWQQLTRVVLLIADAPCHGKTFHTVSRDDYPDGSPGVDILSELRVLQSTKAAQGTMTLNFGRITSLTDKMIDVFHANRISINMVRMEDVGAVENIVSSTVRRSISVTISLTPLSDYKSSSAASDEALKKTYTIEDRSLSDVEWKQQPAICVQVYRNLHITTMDDLRAPLGVGKYKPTDTPTTTITHKRSMLLRRSPNPFAEGGTRLAYRGQLSRSFSDLNNSRNAVVLKSFKHDGGNPNDLQECLKHMGVSNIAYFLADEYNKSRPAQCGSISYLQVSVVEETTCTEEAVGGIRNCFCSEAPLPKGDFVKFSNNTGYWDAEHMDETLLRFSLFSYDATDGYLMLTDLQGVKKENGHFVLTDPAILCKEILRFGSTNLGPIFMQRCIESTRAYMAEHGWNL